jgi:hypothetical protein
MGNIYRYHLFLYSNPFLSPISLYPIGSYSFIPSLQLPYRLGRGKDREPSVHQNMTPSRTACLTQKHQCVRGNTIQLSLQAPSPPQGVTRAQWDKAIPNPPLTQTMLVQLPAASWVSWSWPAVTQPGIEPWSVVTPQTL